MVNYDELMFELDEGVYESVLKKLSELLSEWSDTLIPIVADI